MSITRPFVGRADPRTAQPPWVLLGRPAVLPEDPRTVRPGRAAARGLLVTAVVLLNLPFVFQVFYYKADFPVLYLASKAWPLLVAPLTIYAALALRLPGTPLFLPFLAYALTVTPALSMLYYPSGVGDAVASTAKLWPFSSYFAVAAALVLLRPPERVLRRLFVGLGLATFAVMVILWVTVPSDWYDATGVDSKVFSWDEDRNYFIRMPMEFGFIALFWLGWRFTRERKLWQVAAIAAALVALATIYKARLPMGMCVLVLAFIAFRRMPPRARLIVAALAAVPIAAAIVILGPEVPATLERIFAGSLQIRLRAVRIAWDWIGDAPLKLLFGTGSVASTSAVTLADFFGYEQFWLSDIGWLGVLMEYGLVGTALIVAIHVHVLRTAYGAARGDPFRLALADFVLLSVLVSIVYSVMHAPSPVMAIGAMAWWFAANDRAAEPAGEARPSPA